MGRRGLPGLAACRPDPPTAVTSATKGYFTEEDALASWLEERAERKDGAWKPPTALFADWKAWAESNGEFVGSQKSFSVNLATRGYSPAPKTKARGFDGIALRKGLVTMVTHLYVPPHACA